MVEKLNELKSPSFEKLSGTDAGGNVGLYMYPREGKPVMCGSILVKNLIK